MGENQRSDEETGENQRSDEENDQNQRSGEEIGQNQRSYDEFSEYQSSDEKWRNEEEPRCIVSDPAQPHKVSRADDYETKQDCFSCGKRGPRLHYDPPPFHFYCPTCQVEFHDTCHTFPSKMIHPYHPLTFTFLQKETEMIVDTNVGGRHDFLRRHMPENFCPNIQFQYHV
ncbi:unnamed protein product [Arabis nemorensis]|uniref:DC1 domain-containing protein n=1 Tax=Arabis nemorensis TaxID=586526 RepID=A0A565B4W5_9BRAS|nr:unnamed protein product [Arabis nemorensis]